MERRLAAILAADLVAFSRLMGVDEAGTLTRLGALRASLVEPGIAAHRGRIVKTTGDGFLAEFASALDAVNFAVALQRDLALQAEREGGRTPLTLRIGINVGDVMFEGGDIYGDGVNIAARLEGIAPPGGICISGNVHDHLRGESGLGFRSDGAHMLKNIDRPVEVWRWEPGAAGTAPEPPREVADAKPAIAVLRFQNMSGDPEQDYFADGLAEDLITSLSKLARLTVIARNSSFSYGGRSVKVQEIARDLGVRYLVEGSVRRAGNRVRVSAQLIDCQGGGHLWAERYDRDLTDIFEVQDEVTREIVASLAVKLAPGEAKRLVTKGAASVEAYELFLKGRELHYRYTRDDNAEARALLEASRGLDPGFAPAAAFLCIVLTSAYINAWTDDPAAALESAHDIGREAVTLDRNLPYAHLALGHACLWMREHERALAELAESITVDPNFADGYMLLGWALHFAGRPEEGIAQIERGMRLDPNHAPLRSHWLAQALFLAGRYEQAAGQLRRRLATQPHSDVSRALLASVYGHLGMPEAARAEWAELLRINPEFSVERRRLIMPYRDATDFDRFPEGLRKAGIAA
jgi:TolB-like protein/Tfp pilus assembly protein PilF